jgi:aminoglycoside phosphotransferase (APT) family kinase protein
MPAAEVDVTPKLVRHLLREQHRDLAGLPVELLANGWDNVVFRLGDELAVRMPRRDAAAAILRNEQRWLPVLAPHLPLPVPEPVRTGEPGSGYPWPWSIVPFLPGTPASDTPPADLREAAATIGAFFGALHTPAATDAPANPVRGVPLAWRSETFAQNFQIAAADFDDATRAAITRTWEAALAAPTWDAPPVWLHGDPHPANILVCDGRVSAVIDFGDITAGDPATDLSLAWMMLPADCHDAFRAACREALGDAPSATSADDALWLRARGWALNFSLVFLAHSADNPQLHAIGRSTLAAVLAEISNTLS